MEEFAVVNVVLRPELCGISVPEREGAREWAKRAREWGYQKWSLSEEDRGLWVSSFRVNFQVKQNSLFQFFFMCEVCRVCQPFAKCCVFYKEEFLALFLGESAVKLGK